MPDWLTHTIAGWITGRAAKMDVSLVIVGSLLPDLIKINLVFTALKIDTHGFFDPLHTPVGSLLVAGIIASFFPKIKEAFIFLSVGVTTHFVLDFFLRHTSGGMKLLFPLSWNEWQIYAIRSDNYWVTIFAVMIAIIFYIIMRKKQKFSLKLNR
ncbi:MAG: metal-dependent hydrolase [Candidatus Thermoplasmatota archaeon]|nr:metal-dependent hydrolase [Candidatus Thermoplasmatota archaeon]